MYLSSLNIFIPLPICHESPMDEAFKELQTPLDWYTDRDNLQRFKCKREPARPSGSALSSRLHRPGGDQRSGVG